MFAKALSDFLKQARWIGEIRDVGGRGDEKRINQC